MKMIKCDRCSDEFNEPYDSKISILRVKHGVEVSNDITHYDIELDICKDCYRNIKDYITTKLAQAEPPQ